MDPLSSFSGIASGINFRDLVDAIIQVERRPIDRAQAAITTTEARKAALGKYRALLNTLQSAVARLRNGTAFDALSATVAGQASGGRPILRATAAGSAAPGRYAVEVTALAAAEKRSSLGQADATDPLTLDGTFTINGTAVTVEAGDTLNAIRDRINALNSGPEPIGVTATILTVAPGDHRLVLSSDVTGAAGLTLADSDGDVLATLGLLAPEAVLTEGADAVFRIDGIEVTRSSNVIGDVIAGVTLTLDTAEVGALATVEIDRYHGEVAASLKSFVAAYNTVLEFIAQQRNGGDLQSDATLRTNRSEFGRRVLELLTGEEGIAASGSAIGLSLTRTGTLTLDEAALDEALRTGFADVQTLFGEGGGAEGLAATLDGLLQTSAGILDERLRHLDDQVSGIETRVGRMESRLDRRRASLLLQYTRMEAALAQMQSQSAFLTSQLAGMMGQRPT